MSVSTLEALHTPTVDPALDSGVSATLRGIEEATAFEEITRNFNSTPDWMAELAKLNQRQENALKPIGAVAIDLELQKSSDINLRYNDLSFDHLRTKQEFQFDPAYLAFIFDQHARIIESMKPESDEDDEKDQ